MDLDKIPGLRDFDSSLLTDSDFTAQAIMECLLNNDPEGVMEVIANYLAATDKAALRKKTKLARSTLYSTLKHRNPTIKTLAKIMHRPKRSAKKAFRRKQYGHSHHTRGAIAASSK